MSSNQRPGSAGEHYLQERWGSTNRARGFYNHQVLDRMNDHMMEFIGRMEMAFIATADANGECDSSFRAGEPGFMHVIDAETLTFPDYRGNGVMASMGNIVENGNIGILFVDFTRDTVGLHVNGKARLADSAEVLTWDAPPPEAIENLREKSSRRLHGWIVVTVEEAYIHCSKHIPLMVKADKSIMWGTDDVVRKGGDHFRAKHEDRPWVSSPPATPEPEESAEPVTAQTDEQTLQAHEDSLSPSEPDLSDTFPIRETQALEQALSSADLPFESNSVRG